ncbi:nucleoside recognition domain-containing protein [Clostridium sp. Cult2]|uniref:nucleoside recognition domain-containing protein n=1 Tax=Clostridium sp. Cult2 TaxID=2079003 RepID=UPI001F31DABC|nr:nucleoside recognition domain-containing protein [Clostridium sp. Cult2]MCF6465705.1 nucleoside recognition protein [Clostridium sp. Cult2]
MYKDSVVNGFRKGIITVWKLAKIVVPVYFFVTFLGFTPILNKISNFFEPVMKIIGLPGEASLPLVLGNFINLYAGLGAMASLSLTPKQATILAIMLSFSHSLFLETAVAKKVGVSPSVAVLIRIILALLSGITFNLIL